jgi:hypothetical protein
MQRRRVLYFFLLANVPGGFGFAPALPSQTSGDAQTRMPEAPKPTPGPRVHHRQFWARQQAATAKDELWNDAGYCNIGVCPVGSLCTINVSGSGQRSDPAMGRCCTQTTRCAPFTACLDYGDHKYTAYKDSEEANETLFW